MIKHNPKDPEAKMLALERRVAELEGKLAAINTDEVFRASFLHKELKRMMEPFSELRNTTTLIEQMQMCLNQQSYLEGKVRDIESMVGYQVHKSDEETMDDMQRQALRGSGMSESQIDEILKKGNSFG